MKLKSLQIERQSWGEFEGKLMGKIVFDGPQGSVGLNIDEATSVRLLEVVAGGVVSASQAVANLTIQALAETLRPQIAAPKVAETGDLN